MLPPFKYLYDKMGKNNYKRESLNIIPQILAEKVIKNLTIKASCDPRIIDPANIKRFLEQNCNPLYVCNISVITFGTKKRLLYSATYLMRTLGVYVFVLVGRLKRFHS